MPQDREVIRAVVRTASVLIHHHTQAPMWPVFEVPMGANDLIERSGDNAALSR